MTQKNEKALARAATQSESAKFITQSKDTTSIKDSQINLEKLRQRLENATEERPVTRASIMIQFRITDRRARKMIEDLRDQGVRVCGLSKESGYWIAKTQSEYERFRRDYVSKATTILRRTKNMDERTDKRQVSMSELL